ncbi:short transient receptor potential channel 3 [Plakobranchus ocellatus]|uniref:Short transient receptor potential channel 3 n=1 Tax=Plakobranchus ocellatus TaxID=259542 RepID=A0AAV4CRN4_9GAST|nr:short transient receptor potential channel 3 [Plakobranchus ocellatus]
MEKVNSTPSTEFMKAEKDLLGSGKVKVDCCDQQGRTALEMAVTGNDVDVVCYLLERSSGKHIHKALLAAADNDMERICELILDHPLYRESVRRESERRAAGMAPDSMASSSASATVFAEEGRAGGGREGEEDAFSSANLSKLLLEVLLRAAKRNNFQIVKKIMMCGVFLEEPHDYFCSCQDCTDGRAEDFKVYTTRRLDTYTALASPAYISLTAEDPIMSAFYLSKKFRTLSEIEGEYKQIYSSLDEQVQNFTLALLDQCQSSEEVKAVLSGKPKKEEFYSNGGAGSRSRGNDAADDTDSKNMILPMVNTAVRMEQKKVGKEL